MGILIVAFGIVLATIQFFDVSRLQNLYADLNVVSPLLTQASPCISTTLIVLSLIVGGYLLSTKPNYKQVDKAIAKYKVGEMIKTKELLGNKKAYWLMEVAIAMVGYLTLTVVFADM